MIKGIQLLLILAILLLKINTTFAHPHVFIDSYLTAEFDQKGLSGFQIKWEFDEMMSSGVILDYDTNRDGTFDKEEIKTVKNEVFNYLKNYNYFTEIEIDGKEFKVSYVQNFNPEIIKGKLVYNFFIPCHVNASRQKKVIKVRVYDEEYFSHINMSEKSIKISESKTVYAKLTVYKNRKKSYYFGNVIPLEIKVELLDR